MSDAQPPLWQRLVWYACGAFVLLLLPVLKYAELWQTLPRPQKLALAVALGAFGTACLLSLFMDRLASWSAAGKALIRSFAVLSLFLVAAVTVSISLPRFMLIPLVVAIALIVPLAISPLGLRRLPLAVLVLVAGMTAAYSFGHLNMSAQVERTTRDAYFSTAFYPLHAIIREGWIPEPATRGGGLTLIGDRPLLGTGDGHLYLIDASASGEGFKVTELPTQVPANREEFAKAFGGSARQPKRSMDWREAGPPRMQTWRFRVADVVAAVEGDQVHLFASHHYWNAKDQCFVARVSELTAPLADFEQSVANAKWSTLFETTPCVPLEGPDRKRGKNAFRGEEIGGELLLLEDNKLLLTVGDSGFSGMESTQIFAQDPAADFGKTILIDRATREHRIFTMGHRNPQGLTRTRDGKIWLTEHGEQGGDELNLLQDQANYGWPNVTYGTEYGSNVWPHNPHQGQHLGYRQPTMAWVPSVGTSAVATIDSKLFPVWQDNLLVGSLSSRALYRLVLVEDRVVVQEPIALDKRVRDILQMPDGRIMIWSDDWALTLLEPASQHNGTSLFATQCLGCHGIADGMTHRLGPDLFGVVGRRIGDAPGYDEYSAAMKAQQGAWDEARLDKFLQQPAAAVPGTSMAFPGVPDAQQRKALIEYLKKSEPIDKRGVVSAP
ncbi:PQQ-dependent sugar dehydrogenase [Peristeroidobacter agariperforans]|uniref:PQQ-dependent sugar dehydrogenase n=1 Tax=Peristeroidobacter agariperforans TaxID=268404 RepID=UPI00101BDC39|nr:PQQ-dependent sugar dehydrogenase [Peristeroidobacter agariperforans]